MPVLMTSDLKTRAGEILDAAREQPQFIFRDGQLFMLSPVEPSTGRVLPDGFFAEAYTAYPKDRDALERASAKQPQKAER